MKSISKTAMLFIFASATCFAFAGYVKYGQTLSFKPTTVKAIVTTPAIEPVKATTPIMNVIPYKDSEVEVINLTDENMVVLDQAFDDESVTRVMQGLQKLADKLPSGSTVYLVLNTPGGSVDAGQRLISFIKGLPLKVKTLTLFAASMGFQTAQNLDERLILDSGTLMSHRARFGVQGETSQLQSRLKYFMSIINDLETKAARRMGISLDAYKTLIHDEYWAYGHQAVVEKAADRMVFAKCGKGLSGVKQSFVATLFGMVEVTVSKCPLMPGILVVSGTNDIRALEYTKLMFLNRTEFVNKYITTDKFKEIAVTKE